MKLKNIKNSSTVEPTLWFVLLFFVHLGAVYRFSSYEVRSADVTKKIKETGVINDKSKEVNGTGDF